MFQKILKSACIGACTIGFAGFAAGFFGPLVLTPEANQGPLLGIFITGPLGALLGGIGGAFVGWRRERTGRDNVDARGPNGRR